MSDKLAENEFSPHPHLPVHQHRQQPVAEGGEFLVLRVWEENRGYSRKGHRDSDIRFQASFARERSARPGGTPL